jgi:biopolymer transport protein ExbD
MAKSSSSYDDDEVSTMSELNVVPLVDVVLVLLIVFMLTVPAIVGSAPIKVDLPETTSVAMATAEDLPLHLFLKKDKDSGRTVLYLSNTPINEAGLRDMVRENYPAGKEKPATYIAADATVAWAEVVKVMDMLSRVGLTKFSFDTKHVAGAE